jgi:hypothetical protein
MTIHKYGPQLRPFNAVQKEFIIGLNNKGRASQLG